MLITRQRQSRPSLGYSEGRRIRSVHVNRVEKSTISVIFSIMS